MSGFELDFNVEAILNSLIFQIEIVNEVGMANKSYREVYIQNIWGKIFSCYFLFSDLISN